MGIVEEIKNIKNEIAKKKKELEEVRGEACETYSRIVGYYRAVDKWNKGKAEEYKQRIEFVPGNI